MSETVHYKGTLQIIKPEGTLEDYCKEVMEVRGIEMSDYYKKWKDGSYIHALCGECYNEFLYIKGNLYQVLSQEYKEDWEDIAEAKLRDDGKIDYEVKYYNGGAGFEEMIAVALKKIEL
jgi:hypothetical protein